MGIYNKIMLYFWLVMSVLIVIFVTIMGAKEGFDRWYQSYVFAVIALLMYIVRRWMMKRMVRHMAFLEEQQRQQNQR